MKNTRQFGRYVLEERIAMGGMAEIYRAHTNNEGFQKRVCIKCILPHYLENEDFVRMFRDEAALAAKLQHGNIVQVFDFGEVDNRLFLAMEFVDGADLKGLMTMAKRSRERFRIGQCLQLAIEVCRGLHHAHTLEGLNIVHRDISPHNILLGRNGEIKITDFGIAKAQERVTHTAAGVVKGKLAYMAPEQAEGKALDHRVDQFAAATVFWEMITSERLFAGSNEAETFKKLLMQEIPPPSSKRKDIPPELDDIIMRALNRNPDERFSNMHAFERALSKLMFTIADDPAECDLRPQVRSLLESSERMPRRTAVIEAVKSDEVLAAQSSEVMSLTEAGYERKSEVFANTPGLQNPSIDLTGAVDVSAKTVVVSQDENKTLIASESSGATSVTKTAVPGALNSIIPDTINIDAYVQDDAAVEVLSTDSAKLESKTNTKLFAALALAAVVLGLLLFVFLAPKDQHALSSLDEKTDVGAAHPKTIESVAKKAETNEVVAGEQVAPKDASGTAPSNSALKKNEEAQGVAKSEAAQEVHPGEPKAIVSTSNSSAPKSDIKDSPTTTAKKETTKSTPAKATTRRAKPSAKSTAKKRAQTKEKASLFIDIVGTWAKVSVDGKKRCDTPCTLSLSVGKHSVYLDSPKGKYRRKVVIDAQKRNTLVVK